MIFKNLIFLHVTSITPIPVPTQSIFAFIYPSSCFNFRSLSCQKQLRTLFTNNAGFFFLPADSRHTFILSVKFVLVKKKNIKHLGRQVKEIKFRPNKFTVHKILRFSFSFNDEARCHITNSC